MATPDQTILLLSQTPASDVGVGGVVLRELCTLCAPRRVVECAADNMVDATGARPAPGLQGAWARRSEERRLRQGYHEAAVAMGREHTVSLAWAVLESPTVIATVRAIAAELGVPLVVLAWDSPDRVAGAAGLGPRRSEALLREYGNVMACAASRAYSSDLLMEEHNRRWSSPAHIIRFAWPESFCRPAARTVSDSGALTIGFAGSVTAPDTFDRFMTSLDQSAWRIADRPLRLRVTGTSLKMTSLTMRRVEYCGWVDDGTACELLAASDVLYLPQSFADHWRDVALYSFPNKLSMYLAAGRPILLHASAEASLARFFDRHPFGVHCTSPEPEAVLDCLGKLLSDPGEYSAAAEAAERLRAGEMSYAAMQQSFTRFLECSGSSAPPTEPREP